MIELDISTTQIEADVQRALSEDVGLGDLSAGIVAADMWARAVVICREAATICGRPWVETTLRQLAPDATVTWHMAEGERCEPGQPVFEIVGGARELLTAERTCLNFIQFLSGIATKTAAFVDQVQGTSARVLDTRKTIPGLRQAEKYAVRCGGGYNHRMGLFDAVLIKENHIHAAGSLSSAFRAAQTLAPEAKFIQVEVETLAQLEEALSIGVKMVLLDNMPLESVRRAVAIAGGRCSLEVSGGVNLKNIRNYAQTGVDRISVGALVKDVTAVDFSMRFTT
jgi:nicotinate-nucleotide pyrophosphorylase (carboxylating)